MVLKAAEFILFYYICILTTGWVNIFDFRKAIKQRAFTLPFANTEVKAEIKACVDRDEVESEV